MKRLYEALEEYQKEDYYPFHMPGHKRRGQDDILPWGMDITEISGFDNLHHAEGIIRESMQRAAKVFRADESVYLINGSTAGLLAAIMGSTERGGRVLVARNSHRAVYNAVFLQELEAIYTYPQNSRKMGINCGIIPEDIEKMLITYPDIRTVVVTSPTYEGVVTDIKTIAEIVHSHQGVLIVDEAHGSHFEFDEYFPESAVTQGADVVIQSLHKTLPALTQSAVLHFCGGRADREGVKSYLGILQSSSPSYVLMGGIDRCVSELEECGKELFKSYVGKLAGLRERLHGLKHIRLLDKEFIEAASVFDYDRSKLVLSVRGTNMTGRELDQILRDRYHLEMEMCMGDYVVAMTSVADSQDGYDRLAEALKQIDEGLSDSAADEDGFSPGDLRPVGNALKIGDALKSAKKPVRLEAAAGLRAGEYLYLYPPGIPMLVPGEVINQELAEYICKCREKGLAVQGLKDYSTRYIQVIQE